MLRHNVDSLSWWWSQESWTTRYLDLELSSSYMADCVKVVIVAAVLIVPLLLHYFLQPLSLRVTGMLLVSRMDDVYCDYSWTR